MIHSICIIDDGIPAKQQSLFDIDIMKRMDANTLKFLLRDEIKWPDEENLRSLIEKLITDKESWEVTAFCHPKYFIDAISNDLIRPEIIIYDWEYHTRSTDRPVDHADILYRILNETFSMVFIYSGAEEEKEIHEITSTERFKVFENRIIIKDKNSDISESGESSDEELIKEVNELSNQNFSFKFGTSIRQKSIEAVDKILVNLGKATLNHVYNYFKVTGDSKYDLVNFIGERFKNRLNTMDMENLKIEEAEMARGNQEEKLIKDLWSYRLYSELSEDKVRKGDIVYKVDKDKDLVYLIISDDCDLGMFWHKNYGHISLLPLNKFGKDQKHLCEKIFMTRTEEQIKNNLKHTSLISSIQGLGDGQFFLPFLKIENNYNTYIGFSKEVENIMVPKPECNGPSDLLKNKSLKYSCWNGFKPICRLNEPFLSPLIGYIARALSGFGTPDYAPAVIKVINDDLKKALE